MGVIGSGVIRNDIEKDILKHFSTTSQSQLGKLKTTTMLAPCFFNLNLKYVNHGPFICFSKEKLSKQKEALKTLTNKKLFILFFWED